MTDFTETLLSYGSKYVQKQLSNLQKQPSNLQKHFCFCKFLCFFFYFFKNILFSVLGIGYAIPFYFINIIYKYMYLTTYLFFYLLFLHFVEKSKCNFFHIFLNKLPNIFTYKQFFFILVIT